MSVLQPDEVPLEELDNGVDRRVAAPTVCSCISESLSSPAGRIRLLRVYGQADMLTVPQLVAALDYQLDCRPAHLVVDLAGLTFCSARAMGLILHAGITAAGYGIGYAISRIPPQLDRVWHALWPGELPACYPSAAAAVAALRAHTAP